MSDAAATPYLVHVSPHRREGESVALVMWTVVLALLPALTAGAYVFGWRALWVTALACVSCIVTQVLTQKLLLKRPGRADASAMVTGLLLAFVLPPDVSWYVVVIGSVVAIGLAKQAFGIPHVLCKINDPVRSKAYATLGIDTINRTDMMVDTISRYMGKPAVPGAGDVLVAVVPPKPVTPEAQAQMAAGEPMPAAPATASVPRSPADRMGGR